MQRRRPVYAYDPALVPLRAPRWVMRRHVDLHRVSSAICHA
ncbi:putative leader peptide [Streptomyces sp. NPDC048825]